MRGRETLAFYLLGRRKKMWSILEMSQNALECSRIFLLPEHLEHSGIFRKHSRMFPWEGVRTGWHHTAHLGVSIITGDRCLSGRRNWLSQHGMAWWLHGTF